MAHNPRISYLHFSLAEIERNHRDPKTIAWHPVHLRESHVTETLFILNTQHMLSCISRASALDTPHCDIVRASNDSAT